MSHRAVTYGDGSIHGLHSVVNQRQWIDALRHDGNGPATIKDVARLAGVSRSTVSNVIRGSSTVADDLRQRVLAVIAETNYRPDARARSLRMSDRDDRPHHRRHRQPVLRQLRARCGGSGNARLSR